MDSLEAAVAASPDDPAPLLVWADALLAKGDALGEFISLSYAHTKEADPSRFVRTRARLSELLEKHRSAWLLDAQVTETHWRWGLLRKTAVTVDQEQLFQAQMASEDAPLTTLALMTDELGRVLASPAGRFLEDAGMQLPVGVSSLTPLFELIAKHPRLAGLALSMPGATAAIRFDEAPTIRRWRIIGAPLDASTRLPPNLERLELIDTPVFPGAEEMLTAPSPSLQTLVLGDEHLEIERLVTRLSPATHPALRTLRLIDDLADDILVALSQSPLLRQLDELQLHGPFTDVGLDVIVASAARFARIPRLVFSGGAASGSLKRIAHKRLPQLELPARRPTTAWTGW